MKPKSKKRPSLRHQYEQAIAEATRWREFAQATQAVCLDQQRQIEALTAELRRANAPRIGCDECEYTGFLPGIDEISPYTGEVFHRLTLCPNCRPVTDRFLESFLKGSNLGG